MGRSEKGFTLIELLVVVAILGIIAAVVVLNIGSFIGSGAVESANTEAHQVTTAAIAYMTAGGSITSGWVVGPATGTGDPVEAYLLNPARLQAIYTLNTDGKITEATVSGVTGSKWGSLTFANGAWTETAP